MLSVQGPLEGSIPNQPGTVGQYEIGSDVVRGAGLEFVRLAAYREVSAVFGSPDFSQAKHPDTAIIQGGTVVWVDGEEHAARRRMEQAILRPEPLAEYTTILSDELRARLQEIRALPSPAADLVELMRTSIMFVTARLVGLDGVTTRERARRLRTLTDRIVDGIQAQWSPDFQATMADALAAKADWCREFYQPSAERRRGLLAEYASGRLDRGALPVDLITVMLAHADVAGSDEDMQREATIFSTGSGTTTAQGTCHTVRELSAWLDTHPGDRNRLGTISFLRSAALEALRLHPPAPALMRRALRDTVLPSGREIRAGERVYLDVSAANRDPSVFGSDADDYIPERPEPAEARSYGWTFGGGDHLCSGLHMTIGGAPRPGRNELAYGTLIASLRELYAAGLELDQDPPAAESLTPRGTYRRLRVTFAASSGEEHRVS
jgi:cytochrome P450